MTPGSRRLARKSSALVCCLALSAQQYQALIAADIKTDTRRLDSLDAFTNGATVDTEGAGMRGPRRNISLKRFVEQRRAYFLNHPAVEQTQD